VFVHAGRQLSGGRLIGNSPPRDESQCARVRRAPDRDALACVSSKPSITTVIWQSISTRSGSADAGSEQPLPRRRQSRPNRQARGAPARSARLGIHPLFPTQQQRPLSAASTNALAPTLLAARRALHGQRRRRCLRAAQRAMTQAPCPLADTFETSPTPPRANRARASWRLAGGLN